MKVWVFSDLHMPNADVSIESVLGPIPDADVCVVPGDLIEGRPDDAVRWLDAYVAPVMPVVYVPGNHEFYNPFRSMVENRAKAQRAAERTDGRVHVLDDAAVDIAGTRFIGSTLWTDLEIMGSDPESMAYAARAVAESPDRQIVHEGDEAWTPRLARQQHLQSRSWLDGQLLLADRPVVVVTHHAPHPQSISWRFRQDMETAGYASDLSDLIDRHRPPLWIHGHMHESLDYGVGSTRIVCNPKGYDRENASGFDPAMVLDIG